MNMHGIPQYTLVWGARYTLGARYLSKNMVLLSYEHVRTILGYVCFQTQITV